MGLGGRLRHSRHPGRCLPRPACSSLHPFASIFIWFFVLRPCCQSTVARRRKHPRVPSTRTWSPVEKGQTVIIWGHVITLPLACLCEQRCCHWSVPSSDTHQVPTMSQGQDEKLVTQHVWEWRPQPPTPGGLLHFCSPRCPVEFLANCGAHLVLEVRMKGDGAALGSRSCMGGDCCRLSPQTEPTQDPAITALWGQAECSNVL